MSGHNVVFEQAMASWEEADPGTGKKIPNSGRQGDSFIGLRIGATAETNTLPDPERSGLVLTITSMVQGAGSRAITAATKINQTGNTIMTFSQEADTITLLSIPYLAGTTAGKSRWQVNSNDGVALS